MGSLIRKAARTKFKAGRGDTWTKKQQRGAIYAAKAAVKSPTQNEGQGFDEGFMQAAAEYIESLGNELEKRTEDTP